MFLFLSLFLTQKFSLPFTPNKTNHHLIGSNQLPLWTMTDLLQLNPNTLSTFSQEQSTKATINPIIHVVTKKSSANFMPITKKQQQPIINEVRIVQMQQQHQSSTIETANVLCPKKHKIQAVPDVNNPKRIKGSHGLLANAKTITIKTNPRQQQKQPQQPTLLPQSQPQELDTAAPQLLQQLMAPMPNRARAVDATGENNSSVKWSDGANAGRSSSNADAKMPLQPSNSVLKNLLVSGCDVSAGYICTVPMPIHQKKVARA